MHPGPMNRGVEIATDVADGPYSVILDQVANGVAVRMAVLYLLVARSKAEDAAGEPTPAAEPARGAEGRGHERAAAGRRGGRVVDPARRTVAPGDVLIEDGRIAARRPAGHVDGATAESIDARGLLVAARARRHARAPARAGAGVQGDDRDRRARRRWPAASPPSRACRTPSR